MKKKFMIVSIFCSFLKADIAPGVLEKYRNNIFICTRIGSCRDIEMALYANFNHIYCIEDNKIFINHSQIAIPSYINYIKPTRFQNYFIYYGDSKKLLPEILYTIKEPVTILLNRYFPEIDYPEKPNYILEELNKIKDYIYANSTILIDYIHLEGTEYFGNVSLEKIKKSILSINSRYIFKFEKGGHLRKEENAVLVAYLE